MAAPGSRWFAEMTKAKGFVGTHRAFANSIEAGEQVLALDRRLIKTRFKSDQLIVENVANSPFAAKPRFKIIPASLARIIAESSLVQLLRSDSIGVASLALADSLKIRRPP